MKSMMSEFDHIFYYGIPYTQHGIIAASSEAEAKMKLMDYIEWIGGYDGDEEPYVYPIWEDVGFVDKFDVVDFSMAP